MDTAPPSGGGDWGFESPLDRFFFFYECPRSTDEWLSFGTLLSRFNQPLGDLVMLSRGYDDYGNFCHSQLVMHFTRP